MQGERRFISMQKANLQFARTASRLDGVPKGMGLLIKTPRASLEGQFGRFYGRNRRGGELTHCGESDHGGHPWDNRRMLELDPSHSEELAFALSKAVKQSGLTLAEIADRLEQDYGEKLSVSALSHSIWRGSIRLQRALQILAVCGVTEIKICACGQEPEQIR